MIRQFQLNVMQRFMSPQEISEFHRRYAIEQAKGERGYDRRTHKRCAMCDTVKPVQDFYRRSGAASRWRQSYCKPCCSTYKRKREIKLLTQSQ